MRSSRINTPGRFALSLVAAVCLQAGLLGGLYLWEQSRPLPESQLEVSFAGDGEGKVQIYRCANCVTTGGDGSDWLGTRGQIFTKSVLPSEDMLLQPMGNTCSGNCTLKVSDVDTLVVKVVPNDGNVFGGFGGCELQDDPRSCVARPIRRLRNSGKVRVTFDRIASEVEVALVELPKKKKQPEKKEEEKEKSEEEKTDKLKEKKPKPKKKELVAQLQQQQPPPQPKANMKAVEVKQEKSEKAPTDAKYLSDEDRDTEKETRAEKTNLDKAQDGADKEASEASSNEDEKDPGAAETLIADTQDQENPELDAERDDDKQSGKVASVLAPMAGGDGLHHEHDHSAGKLNMRDIKGNGSLIPTPSDRKGGKRGLPGLNHQLSLTALDSVMGTEKVLKQQERGRKWRSKRRGNNKYQKKQRAVKMALENFITEVTPGNQTRLKTRKSPFAAYLAHMHRDIHRLWGFGYLLELDKKGGNHPLNNWDLISKLEIIVNSDGTIDRINIAKHSGVLEFDVAAIDTVLTAGPFDPPPRQILSPDGKVYLHWGFYRNHRQCGTFNAQPFILAKAPTRSGPADSETFAKRKRKGRKTVGQLIESQRNEAFERSGVLSTSDPEAKKTANVWISGYARRSVKRMLGVSRRPFRSGESFSANSEAELKALYKTLISETRGKFVDWKLLTASGFRKRFRNLPRGLEVSKDQLLLAVTQKKEQFVVVLEKSGGGTFRAVGLYR